MENLITVSGVTGYIDENGIAQLCLTDVAHGLGFTEKAASGNTTIRWRTVRGYLNDFGIAASCDEMLPNYIPENIFYRLAMKAKNEVAEKFQGKVADEILPAIRKTGTYSAQPMTEIQMLAAQAQMMVQLESRTSQALESANSANQRISGALNALAAPTDIDWQTATGDKVKRIAAENQLSYPVLFGDLYKELESATHVNLTARVSRLQGRMKQTGYKYTDRQAVSKLHVISLDAKLRLAFDGIVRRVDAKYTATRLPQ